ncbi:MAG: chemotaxis protein CheW [Acidimicrobiia bacterium]
MSMTMIDDRQICTFWVDGNRFGVWVQHVQEVLTRQEMTRVPLAPPVVRGLTNLRGEIVTAVDLRRRLRIADRPDDVHPMHVVVQTKDGPVSLLVDEIGEVIEIDDAAFETPPVTLDPATRDLLHGVYKLERGLLLLLDTERAVDFDPAVDSES